MQKILFKKGLSIGIFVLFIGTIILPVSGIELIKKTTHPLSNGYIFYVGGAGPGNYSSIQDAIDAAHDGDTVFVYDDSSPYYENVEVYKSINLIGENKKTTIIDGSRKASTIHLISDKINISGFTIQNSGRYHPNAGILVNESNYTKIHENIIMNNEAHGILFRQSGYACISNNVIKENDEFGIGLQGKSTNNITIISNEISYNYAGIAGFFNTKDFFIYRNSIVFNEMVGLFFDSSHNIVGYNNDIINKKANIYDNYGPNEWENETYGGNYWGDYNGVDNDGDGIGDTPYKFDFNKDLFPLMNPVMGIYVDGKGPYIGNIDVAINFESTVHGGVPPYEWLWEFGDGDISTEQDPSHEYSSPGIYYAKVTVIDDNDTTAYNIVTAKISHPPGTSVYVDDDYNESTPGWEYDHFNEIQDGIDLCGDHGTVNVYKGLYCDSGRKRSVLIFADPKDQSQYITLNKPLTLLGEDKDNTILDGAGKAEIIKIKADGVAVSGFTIQGYVSSMWGVDCSGNDCVISNNRIYDEGRCIVVQGSNIEIYGNELTSNSDSALMIWGCNNIDVYRNNITNCDAPFDLFLNKKVKFYENNFINNVVKTGFWADLFLTQINPLAKTSFSRNYWYRPRLLPKMIIGVGLILIGSDPYPIPIPVPIFDLDYFPAKEPYSIKDMESI